MIPALCKWIGSKRGLLSERPEVFPMPEPGRVALVPFVGAGSVVASYVQRGARVIASDADPRLVGALVAVRADVHAVVRCLQQVAEWWRSSVLAAPVEERDAVGRRVFERVRADLDVGDAPIRAARFLFVIRAGFNGLYRQNTKGQCNTPYGKPDAERRDLVAADELRAFAALLRDVDIHCEDSAITCARARQGDAVYLDPPYSGTFTNYTPGGDDWNDPPPSGALELPGVQVRRVRARERLAAMLDYLDAIGARWTLSDADTATTRTLYARWPSERVWRPGTVSSNGADRGDVAELVWSNWRPAAAQVELELPPPAPVARRSYRWAS